MKDPIALSGAPGSPYTRKMLAVLRYRRIPYRFLPPSGPALAGLPQPKVSLLPTFYLPDQNGELAAVTDSSPIIRRLEREHEGRSLIPSEPALAFIDELIEDYADEWLTKAMFHYRWSYEADIAKAAAMLPCWRGFCIPDEDLAERGRMVADRQIGRLRYVGSNAVTGPVIEASYRRFLIAFEDHLRRWPYLLGHRPSASDFAVDRLGRADGGPVGRRAGRGRLDQPRRAAADPEGAAGRNWPGLPTGHARQRRRRDVRRRGGAGGGRWSGLEPAAVPVSGQVPALAARGARRSGRG
jgi:glutathione S-transferase